MQPACKKDQHGRKPTCSWKGTAPHPRVGTVLRGTNEPEGCKEEDGLEQEAKTHRAKRSQTGGLQAVTLGQHCCAYVPCPSLPGKRVLMP